MSEIKIDKGVPVPTTKTGGNPRFPWHEMEVGDSFFVPDGSGIWHAGNANRRYAPKRFISRTVEGGIRVWRVE